ncbi:hypothetical protein ACH5RR_035147 [Cinchona calisaya]|uniref:F-box domain-containing protein n=1 Tax=Cinchona calisaya TaxID=153742 RepID=A0ABD2YEB4_9GENT
METDTIELGNLCPQVIDSIFSKIPLKSLVKLKSVSKTWCKFIEHIRRCHPPTTTSGLAILLKHHHRDHQDFQETTFLKSQEGREGFFFRTIASIKHNFPLNLIDSCDGYLLYATNNGDSWTYYICSPSLDQCLALPQAHGITRLTCASLAFDDSRRENLRVLCFFLKEIDFVEGTMSCMIFLSETWEWREFQARILNSDLLLERDFETEQLFGSSVFCRGRLYWMWSVFMLVYDNQGVFFKLIPLPTKAYDGNVGNPSNLLSQFLWESDGEMYFCYQINEGLCIFKFIGDDQVLEGCCLWKFNQFVMLKEFIWRKLEYMGNGKVVTLRAKCRIKPCAFNQDLQLLYLLVPPGRIVSYSLETRELEQVWACGELEGTYATEKILPFLFKSVD